MKGNVGSSLIFLCLKSQYVLSYHFSRHIYLILKQYKTEALPCIYFSDVLYEYDFMNILEAVDCVAVASCCFIPRLFPIF